MIVQLGISINLKSTKFSKKMKTTSMLHLDGSNSTDQQYMYDDFLNLIFSFKNKL